MSSSYNCSDSNNQAYGAGDFGLCNGQTVGAPNTGMFWSSVDSAGFTIVAPVVIAIVVVVISSAIINLRRKGDNTKV